MGTHDPALSLHRQLWYTRAFYFCFLGSAGCLIPFLGLFYARQGLSGVQIGLISTTTAILALFAAPLWGRWSDAIRGSRRLLQITLALTGLAALGLGQQHSFAGILLMSGLQTFIGAGTSPLADTLALKVVRRGGGGFGSVRLGGSLGWAVVTMVSGKLIELAGLGIGFISYAAGMTVSALVANLLPAEHASRRPPIAKESMAQLFGYLRRNTMLRGLAVALVITWFGSSSLHLFEAIYLDQLGASEWLIGFASAIPAIVELGGMLWADRLEKKYGAGRLLRTALLVDAVRYLMILFFPTVSTIVILRIIGGIRFSFYSVAVLSLVNNNSPERHSVTILALFDITLRNLVQMISSPISGFIFDTFGAYWLYSLVLGGNLCGWLALKLTVKDQ